MNDVQRANAMSNGDGRERGALSRRRDVHRIAQRVVGDRRGGRSCSSRHTLRPAGLRKVIPMVILAVVTIALAACGGETDERTGGSSGSPSGATTVTIWAHHGQPAENEAMRAIIDAFNVAHADRGVQAAITFFPDQQYPQKVSIAAASGSLPDLIDIDGPYVGPWAAEGLLRPLDSYVGEELRADLLPTLIDQGTYEGSLYALGAFESALVVYYNRDMIEKAGLAPPDRVADAWTWDEFVEALQQVAPHTPTPITFHMEDQSSEWFTYAFSPLIWSNGGELIDTEQFRAVGVLNSPASIRAIERWRDVFSAGLAEATGANPDPFSAGLVAFDWTGHWMLPTYEAHPDLRFGVMPLPKMGPEAVVASGSWCWGITRAADDPDAAWTVLEWLLNPEHGIAPIVRANGAVPGRLSAFALFPEYEEMPRRLFREQLETAARARPRTPVYLTLTSEFSRSLRDIATGADVEPRMTQAAEVVQRELDRAERQRERRRSQDQ